MHNRRKAMSKGSFVARYKHDVRRTHPMNVKIRPQRGGWRL